MSEMVHDAAPAVETPAEAPAAEEAWAPSQEEWEQQQQAIGALIQHVSQQQAPEPPPQQHYPQPTQFDPFSDDPGSQLRAIIREEIGPLAAHQQYEMQSEAEERAYDILDDISSRLGELDNRETALPMVRAWADTLMPQMAQRYGFGPKAAEAALEASYQAFQELFGAVGKSYTDRHLNQLTNLGNVRAQPPTFPGSAEAVDIPAGGDELDLVRRYGGYVPGQ